MGRDDLQGPIRSKSALPFVGKCLSPCCLLIDASKCFNPPLLAWKRQVRSRNWLQRSLFQSTPTRWAARTPASRYSPSTFQPALPCVGSENHKYCTGSALYAFQSMPEVKATTLWVFQSAPCPGGDQIDAKLVNFGIVSIHAPRAACDTGLGLFRLASVTKALRLN